LREISQVSGIPGPIKTSFVSTGIAPASPGKMSFLLSSVFSCPLFSFFDSIIYLSSNITSVIIIETISFLDGIKYPFKTPNRLIYVLLLLIPIFGWLVLIGYVIRLINEFIEGKYEGLIKLDIMEDLKLGFIIFLKSLPFEILLFVVMFSVNRVNVFLSLLVNLILLFLLPILRVNFYRKQTVGSYFEFGILNVVKDNLGNYVIAALEQYVLTIVCFAFVAILIFSLVMQGNIVLYIVVMIPTLIIIWSFLLFTNSIFIQAVSKPF